MATLDPSYPSPFLFEVPYAGRGGRSATLSSHCPFGLQWPTGQLKNDWQLNNITWREGSDVKAPLEIAGIL